MITKPHHTTGAEWIIQKKGSDYQAINGETGNVEYSNSAFHTLFASVIAATTNGKIDVRSDVTLTAGITGAADVILDFNNHVITPTSSFNVVTMKPNFHFINFEFDVSGITLADDKACIYIDGSDHYNHPNAGSDMYTLIQGGKGVSTSSQGRFLWMDCDANAHEIARVVIRDCSTFDFKYAYYLEASADQTGCWINANVFDNLYGDQDEHFIYMNRAGSNASINDNYFNFTYQFRTNSDTCVTCDGDKNNFICSMWDIGAGQKYADFQALSNDNMMTTTRITAMSYFTRNGTNNFVYSGSLPGFTGVDNFTLFKGTSANPYFQIYGDDSGTVRVLQMQVNSSGHAIISSQTGASKNLKLIGYDIELAPTNKVVDIDDFIKLTAMNSAPGTPATGMVCYADGTTWDPSDGSGLYLYDGAAWRYLGGAGTT